MRRWAPHGLEVEDVHCHAVDVSRLHWGSAKPPTPDAADGPCAEVANMLRHQGDRSLIGTGHRDRHAIDDRLYRALDDRCRKRPEIGRANGGRELRSDAHGQ